MREILDRFIGKGRQALSSLTVAWCVFLVLTACDSKSSSQIQNEILDMKSELLTRGDNQRGINRRWKDCQERLWKGDSEAILKMLEWAEERSIKNGEKYYDLLEAISKKEMKLDEAKAKEARAGCSGSASEYPFDPNQFANSDSAIIESIRNWRNNGNI